MKAKPRTTAIRALFALALLGLTGACATPGATDYGIPAETLEALQDQARNPEPALPLPMFEIREGTLEDGRLVAYLDGPSLAALEDFVENSFANREALKFRTRAFGEVVEALVFYDGAVRDLDDALQASRMSCRIWTGAGLVGGILLGGL